MKIIGLTGNIASGKTTISNIFGNFGAIVLNIDKLSHECLEEKKDIINKEYGTDYKKFNSFSRKKLAKVVFKNKDVLNKFCSIIHPCVIKKIDFFLKKIKKQNSNKIVVLDCPLLLESGIEKLADYIVVVEADFKLRIKRAKNKRYISKSELIKRDKYQLPQEEKIKNADFIINNNNSLQESKKQVKKVWEKINGV